MRLDGQGNLIFEKMGFSLDKERVQMLSHALNPNGMGVIDRADDETWKRRRAAKAMVDAGLDPSTVGASDSDRLPLDRRIGNFLDDGAYGTGTLVVRADEIDGVQEALGHHLDYSSSTGWYEGDRTAKAQELGREIAGLAVGEQTSDAY